MNNIRPLTNSTSLKPNNIRQLQFRFFEISIIQKLYLLSMDKCVFRTSRSGDQCRCLARICARQAVPSLGVYTVTVRVGDCSSDHSANSASDIADKNVWASL